ncbi:hypothetical protein QBC46DRAFT_401617 [Diplogelasinospora grovesii]|uniref:NACHT-NTPase and P-loop NTPases N-terminal domain-containing protein n=1 Tax=Diplogelasinospora grovesii TaxID=303347 RepID=A0AAN6RYB5_9PEZI|nr:hypothetical protein QBC46DRAFT_401617 [Diplogelasinospora grovesii]
MDPLTALSVAASVIQFIQFASSLISNTNEIYDSANGASANTLHLEDVYSKLKSLSKTLSVHVGLQIPPGHAGISGSSNKLAEQKLGEKASPDQGLALVQLSADCKADCNELLKALEKLKVRSEGSLGKRL